MSDPHPADGDKPREHPPIHEHQWVPVENEWREVIRYQCACGASRPA